MAAAPTRAETADLSRGRPDPTEPDLVAVAAVDVAKSPGVHPFEYESSCLGCTGRGDVSVLATEFEACDCRLGEGPVRQQHQRPRSETPAAELGQYAIADIDHTGRSEAAQRHDSGSRTARGVADDQAGLPTDQPIQWRPRCDFTRL